MKRTTGRLVIAGLAAVGSASRADCPDSKIPPNARSKRSQNHKIVVAAVVVADEDGDSIQVEDRPEHGAASDRSAVFAP